MNGRHPSLAELEEQEARWPDRLPEACLGINLSGVVVWDALTDWQRQLVFSRLLGAVLPAVAERILLQVAAGNPRGGRR